MNKEGHNQSQNKNQLFDQVLVILALKGYQISWKPMSSHYAYIFYSYKWKIGREKADFLRIHQFFMVLEISKYCPMKQLITKSFT